MKLWVGSYSSKGGKGLYPLTRCGAGGWSIGAPFEEAANASFGCWSPKHGVQYLVDEEQGLLQAFRQHVGWSLATAIATGGSQPCYVALSPGEWQLAVANYGDGSVALFALDERGLPSQSPQLHRHSGRGPHPDRQQGPHAHCAAFSPDAKWLYHVDLGTDEILAFPAQSGLGEPRRAFRAPPSSGPRHLLFHPSGNFCFLISELASTVQVLRPEGTKLKALQSQSTLPSSAKEESLGGHIGLNARGDRIYVTNRGHDSVATFSFEGEQLSLLQHRRSGGASPRFFLLLEEQQMMVIANEEGGNVTAFRIEENGTLGEQIFDLPVPGAAFLFRDRAN